MTRLGTLFLAMSLTLASVTASAQPLRCGPVNRGRPNATGTGCDCQPGFHPQLLLGALRCRPDATPRPPPGCGPEEHLSAGHCCGEGEAWAPERRACVCIDPDACGSPPPESSPSPPPVTSPRNACSPSLEYVPGTDHCCWPGQQWVLNACRGTPSRCPPRFHPGTSSCVLEGCPRGTSRASDGESCCWPNQELRDGVCSGEPACPRGFERAGNSCTLTDVTIFEGSDVPSERERAEAEFQRRRELYRISRWLPSLFAESSLNITWGLDFSTAVTDSGLFGAGIQMSIGIHWPWFEVGGVVLGYRSTISADDRNYTFTPILSPFAGVRLLSWPSLGYDQNLLSVINLAAGVMPVWGYYTSERPRSRRGPLDGEVYGYIANDFVVRLSEEIGLHMRVAYAHGLLSNGLFAPMIQFTIGIIGGIEPRYRTGMRYSN